MNSFSFKKTLKKIFRKVKINIENIEAQTENLKYKNFYKTIQPTHLRGFELHLVDHCNLNCRGCTHFSPLAEKNFLSKQDFEKDFCRLSDLTQGNVDYIHLLGGEPLLHPDILFFLKRARDFFNETAINLITNGILLKKQNDKFYETCRENKINIILTYYPINLDLNFIYKKFVSYNIKYEIYGQRERERERERERILSLPS